MDTMTDSQTVKKVPGWHNKPDSVTGLIQGKYTREQYAAKIAAGKAKKAAEREAAANARVQEVEVTRGPNGLRIKFVGCWNADEKAALISKMMIPAASQTPK